MSKLELSINVKYLPSWGAWEGIRELVQNGKDAETEFDAPLKVTHYNSTLRIENEGATLSREALLFGTSSKTDRSDMIGKFGEGLKLGVLALVRGGRQVKIRTGGEVWSAAISRSEKYDADVLCFDIRGGNEDKKRVRVEIENVTEVDWNGLKERFLFLGKLKKDERVETNRGDLLLSDRFKGKVYVKGIYVQGDPRLSCGYNFSNLDVDRDRKMVSSWDLQWECSAIWREAIGTRPDLLDPFFTLLQDNKADVHGIADSAGYISKDVQENAAARFIKQFGKDAIPVATTGESAEVEHLGKRGIVVSKPLGALLAQIIDTKDTLVKKSREDVTRSFSWSDLSETQKTNLIDAMKLITAARPDCTLDLVDVVEFRSDMMGRWKDGRVLIACKYLDDRDETLATLVHEFAHKYGGDGEADHVRAIENCWRDIVKALRAPVTAGEGSKAS
jgi:hypothetical protein